MEENKASANQKGGFINDLWCGDEACEEKMKNDAGLSSRCMPFELQDNIDGVCPMCGKKANHMVYWGRAY